ncbi:MAG TPA: hypothetical protein VGL39_14335 [Jatrophihabitantaceae bacterium]|jgi:hypothetical protein
MIKRSGSVAALVGAALAAALIGGGTAYATAGSSGPAAPAPAKAHTTAVVSAVGADTAEGPDTPAGSSETAGEQAPEPGSGTEKSAPESDGPGGHADPEGVNVDHQFNGNE